MMRRKMVATVFTAAALTITMSITVLAGNPTYQITSGDTGKTTTWTNPYTRQIMTAQVVTMDAKITFTGDSGQLSTMEFNKDGSLLAFDSMTEEFSVNPTQELDIAEVLDRLSSNHTSTPMRGQVPFPDEWVYYVAGNGLGNSIPDMAFYVTANPDSTAGNPVQDVGEGWKQDSDGWWYQNADGSYPQNAWKEINGKQYYFGGDGYMLHDTTTPDGYQVDSNGEWIQ